MGEKHRFGKYLGAAIAAVASTCVSAAEIWVNSEADDIDPDACTLRAAIESVNSNSSIGGCTAGNGQHLIRFNDGLTSFSLTQGPLQITSDIIIDWFGYPNIIIDAQSNSRVFQIDANVSVAFHGLTITGGDADSGAGLRVDDGADVWLDRVDIIGNAAGTNGGGIELLSGTIHLWNSSIQGNQAESGGGVHIQEGQAWFEESLIENNQAERGGGIAIEWEDTSSNWFYPLEMTSTPITGNQATEGGGLYLTSANHSTLFEFEDLIIQQNTATRYGGGVAVNHGFAGFLDSLIQENDVVAPPGEEGCGGGGLPKKGCGGGGIAKTGSGVLWLGLSTVNGNSAPEGGGILLSPDGWAGEVSIDGSLITHNYAENQGGGIALRDGRLWSHFSQIEHNTAAAGGGIHAYDARLDLFESNVQYNQAGQGGGLALQWPYEFHNGWLQLNLESSPIRYNQAEVGGGVFFEFAKRNNYQFTFEGFHVSDNEATVMGGGIAVNSSEIQLEDVLVENNQVVPNGDDGHGGGIALTGGSQVLMSNCAITGNSAPAGGGIYLEETDMALGWLGLDFCSVTNNTAQRGGGVAQDGSDFTAFETGIEHNHADVGGGFHITGGYFNLDSVSLQHNSASKGGGIAGVFEGLPLPIWNNGTFESTPIQNNQADIGGGIYLDITGANGVEIELRELEILDNQAAQLGGGIAIVNGDARLIQTLIDGNEVTGARGDDPAGGGGIAMTAQGHLFLDQSIISGNSAPAGGGVYVNVEGPDWGGVSADFGEISQNSALFGGGAALVKGGFYTYDTQIESNHATIGGGLDLAGWDFLITNTSLRYNAAEMGGGAAVRYQETPDPWWNSDAFGWTTIEENQADIGGGMYIDITDANGIEHEMRVMEFLGNQATQIGGGIAVVNGNTRLVQSLIQGNEVTDTRGVAQAGGGGIAATTQGVLWLDEVVVTDNSAPSGGGIYIDTADDQFWGMVFADFGEISGNSAQTGGGVALASGGFSASSTEIEFNQAMVGGGLDIAGWDFSLHDSSLRYNIAEKGGGVAIRIQEMPIPWWNAGAFGSTPIENNEAVTGGGILVELDPENQLHLENLRVSGNEATSTGGGIAVAVGSLELTNSAITGNSGLVAGGIDALPVNLVDRQSGGAVFTLVSSTISGNSGGTVGGVRAESADIRFSTIAFNTQNGSTPLNSEWETDLKAGGVAVRYPPTLRNTIVAANDAINAPADLSVFVPGGQTGPAFINFSLVQDESGFVPDGAGNLFGLAPGLAPLDANGAANTLTHALQPDSPAIHNGDPAFAPPPQFDQRGPGFPRLLGGRLDIGAFESALAPAAMVSENSFAFGDVRVAHSADPLTLVVSNEGDGALIVEGVALADSGNGAFGLLEEPCSTQILAPGESCEVTVGFEPNQTGPFEGGITVTTNADGTPVLVSLYGQGVAAEIMVDPTTINFGTVVAGQPGSVRELTVSNIGEHALTIDSITGLSSPFELVDTPNCQAPPLTLLPEETCVFVFNFNPSEIGHFEQTLTLESDAEAGTSSVVLIGTGIGVALFEDRFEAGGGTP